MFTMHPYTKFHIPTAANQLAIALSNKSKLKFAHGRHTGLHSRKINKNSYIFRRSIIIHQYRAL